MDFHALYLRNKFWITDFFKGSPIGRPYRDVKYLQEHSFEEGKHIREKALHDLLDYARAKSPYYKNINGYDLRNFPIMNKSSLIEHYEEIRVSESDIPNQIGPVHIQTTSGSTGTPFKIPQDTCKRMRRIAELKYFGAIAGFKTHEKLIHLRTWNKWQQKTARQIKSENIIPFDIASMGDEDLKRLCELAISSKAVCLRGYASSLGRLAQYAEGKGYRFPHLKLAIAGAESLQDDVRALFKKVMKADIQSQYANEECGILAQERVPTKESDNPMYWNIASYYFEVLKFDSDEPVEYGELGRIVITDLYNHAFPLIRYDNGDTAVLLPPDEYSHGYPVLGKLYGRRFDLTYSIDNKAISPLSYGRILKHYENIAQWQVVQESQTDFVLKLVMRKEDASVCKAIEQFKEFLGKEVHITIEYVNDIPVLASGKRKPVVNNWKK